jgi:mannosyltransferase
MRQAAADFARSRAGAALLLVTAVGATLRFATLGQQSYWYDEAITASMLDGSLPDVLSGVAGTESTPPLYYVLAWIWAQLLGSDETSLRSLSALAGTLTIPVAYAAGRAVATARIGLAAAALGAVSPVLIWYSQEARAYALLALLGGISFVLFALARSEPSPRRLVSWAIVCGLALATHYFAVFMVFAESVLLLWAHPRRPSIRWAVGCVAATTLAFLPLAAAQAQHRGRVGWIGGLDLGDRVTEALQRLVTAAPPSTWAGATGSHVRPFAWIAAVAALGLAAALLLRRGSPRERTGATLALLVVAISVGIPIAGSLAADALAGGDGDVFLDRNVLGAWVALAVFVAGGLAARRAGPLGAAGLAALIIWSLVVDVRVARNTELHRDDWRGVAAVLPTGDGTAVVVYPAFQAPALTRQRSDLVDQVEPERADRVVLVLAGLREPPPVFRVPRSFARSRVRELQHFVVIEFKAATPVTIGPSDLARGRVRDAELRVLVIR